MQTVSRYRQTECSAARVGIDAGFVQHNIISVHGCMPLVTEVVKKVKGRAPSLGCGTPEIAGGVHD